MEELFSLFTLQISKCSRCIRKIKQEEMETFDLKGPHVSCLYYLYKSNGSLTLKELCDICDEDKAYISRAVDSLEKDGYIECNSKTEKRYTKNIYRKRKRKLMNSLQSAGRIVKENGKVLGIDRHTLIHEAEAAMDKVWTRARETGTL